MLNMIEAPACVWEQPAWNRKHSAACRRCQELSNGTMVQGVADLWGRDADAAQLRLVSPEQLRTQLAQVGRQLLPLPSIHRLHAACKLASLQCRMAGGRLP